jgi:hypothetical protein
MIKRLDETSLSIEKRRAFLKLPMVERRRILQDQAENPMTHYQANTKWQDLQVGDLIEPGKPHTFLNQ